MIERNADGQFPKKFDCSRSLLHEIMGFSEEKAKELVDRWNEMHRENLSECGFLEALHNRFKKDELIFLFTLAKR